jgi:hypothetical protein
MSLISVSAISDACGRSGSTPRTVNAFATSFRTLV